VYCVFDCLYRVLIDFVRLLLLKSHMYLVCYLHSLHVCSLHVFGNSLNVNLYVTISGGCKGTTWRPRLFIHTVLCARITKLTETITFTARL